VQHARVEQHHVARLDREADDVEGGAVGLDIGQARQFFARMQGRGVVAQGEARAVRR
jgi:hypothetical protein